MSAAQTMETIFEQRGDPIASSAIVSRRGQGAAAAPRRSSGATRLPGRSASAGSGRRIGLLRGRWARRPGVLAVLHHLLASSRGAAARRRSRAGPTGGAEGILHGALARGPGGRGHAVLDGAGARHTSARADRALGAVERAAGHDGVDDGEPAMATGRRRRVDDAGAPQANSTWGGARAETKVAGSAGSREAGVASPCQVAPVAADQPVTRSGSAPWARGTAWLPA
jgi:hypothetical protein